MTLVDDERRLSRVLPRRSEPSAVVVPFENPSPPSIARLIGFLAADMERVNAVILSRTGSEVTMIPEVAIAMPCPP